MTAPHPLDRCAWSALNGRHSPFAIIRGGARRYDLAYGVFAAVADQSDASLAGLADLIAEQGDVALLEADPPARIPGVAVVSQDLGVQMVAPQLTPGPRVDFAIVPLSEADAPAMRALTALTEPGPFFARTHQLGDFVGVKIDGELIAMAGERMKPDGFTEVSGVCTHPDHRGRGYAGALMRHVATRILGRGETPFLHAYAANTGAIALYEALGFTLRREVLMTRLTRA
ncbi:GNAT family N-acetyltransferase [Sphingomonas lycopersici]|uniref:GNAT family N-acetyltransferase n=1 Tax=Sphingomonas lycopersici TaxID=2951807 RepID=A0AA41ZCG7_9SPHN|nr:GNAT family N-acetyltransferase [Sphingomonas lycopersici]MCW6529712.1 GNAT family N-acetyltransferase [Sphingomonas lycopersici]MCW6534369.1 GNAT family N-acetyltransferase [Sphingomonas lycopersici]